jgi:hypothetical protein
MTPATAVLTHEAPSPLACLLFDPRRQCPALPRCRTPPPRCHARSPPGMQTICSVPPQPLLAAPSGSQQYAAPWTLGLAPAPPLASHTSVEALSGRAGHAAPCRRPCRLRRWLQVQLDSRQGLAQREGLVSGVGRDRALAVSSRSSRPALRAAPCCTGAQALRCSMKIAGARRTRARSTRA